MRIIGLGPNAHIVSLDIFSKTRDLKGNPVELTGKARASSEVPMGVCLPSATP